MHRFLHDGRRTWRLELCSLQKKSSGNQENRPVETTSLSYNSFSKVRYVHCACADWERRKISRSFFVVTVYFIVALASSFVGFIMTVIGRKDLRR